MAWGLLASVVLAARWIWPPRGAEAVGPTAWRDLGLTLGLSALVLALCHSAGVVLLGRLRLEGMTGLERTLFASALGIGVLGYAVTGLGLLALLRPIWIAALVVVMAALLGTELSSSLRSVGRALRGLGQTWAAVAPVGRAFLILAMPIGFLALVQALAPPWDYDGLMYHLAGPQRFLQAGRLFPDIDNWYINGPFTVEMVFGVGMAFGDDVFPKLIHFAAGGLLLGATYAAGRRWLGERGGWIAAAVLLSVPTLPIWASFAYIDLAWSVLEFLALFAVLIWREQRRKEWLVLAGVLIGLALGSKYLALSGAGVLGVLIALLTLRQGIKVTLGSLLAFGLPALAVASPWYLKNLAWLSNPVYPFLFGGPGWSSERLVLYGAYLNSFGTGRSLLDYLWLPWNAYAEHARYGTMMNRIDIPAPLFPLLVAFPFLRKPRAASALLWVSLGRIALWEFGSQQLRFLMPIYPALAVATAEVIERLVPRIRSRRLPWHAFLPTLAMGMTALTLAYQGVALATYRPVAAVAGLESRTSFLARIVKDYAATRFVLDSLPTSSRVLLLRDGRAYYCGDLCASDPDHFRWSAEISGLPTDEDLASWFRQHSFTHVLLSIEDLDFLLQHDTRGVVRVALDRLLAWRDAGCLEERFDDGWASVWEVVCP
ncbi:MAG: glycosyltransferase family 39 protein [Chloroflexota bacterium]